MPIVSSKYPLILNGIKFIINPTQLKIRKSLVSSNMDTMGGRKWQIWYQSPEVLEVGGSAFGTRAVELLRKIKRDYSGFDKVSRLYYKTKYYSGFLTDLDVSSDMSHVNIYKWNFTFQLLQGEEFKPEDFALQKFTPGALDTANLQAEAFVATSLSKFENSLDKILQRIQ